MTVNMYLIYASQNYVTSSIDKTLTIQIDIVIETLNRIKGHSKKACR